MGSFTKNAGGFANNIEIGNQGWLRDRYGTDIKVKIQSYTRYLDESDPSNSSTITFGNKIFDSMVWSNRQSQANAAQKALTNRVTSGSDVSQRLVTMDAEQMAKIKKITNGGS